MIRLQFFAREVIKMMCTMPIKDEWFKRRKTQANATPQFINSEIWNMRPNRDKLIHLNVQTHLRPYHSRNSSYHWKSVIMRLCKTCHWQNCFVSLATVACSSFSVQISQGKQLCSCIRRESDLLSSNECSGTEYMINGVLKRWERNRSNLESSKVGWNDTASCVQDGNKSSGAFQIWIIYRILSKSQLLFIGIKADSMQQASETITPRTLQILWCAKTGQNPYCNLKFSLTQAFSMFL